MIINIKLCIPAEKSIKLGFASSRRKDNSPARICYTVETEGREGRRGEGGDRRKGSRRSAGERKGEVRERKGSTMNKKEVGSAI